MKESKKKKTKQDYGKGEKGVPEKRFERLPLGKFFHVGGARGIIGGGSSSSDGAVTPSVERVFFLGKAFSSSLHHFYIH